MQQAHHGRQYKDAEKRAEIALQRLFQQGERLAHPSGSSYARTGGRDIAAGHGGSSPVFTPRVRLRARPSHQVPMHDPRQREHDKRRREQRPAI